MAEVHVVDADEAAGMSRQQAIRTLAAAGDRRAQIMLAGHVVTDANVQRLRSFRPTHSQMAVAVHFAMLELQAVAEDQRAQDRADALELQGLGR